MITINENNFLQINLEKMKRAPVLETIIKQIEQ